MQAKLYSSGGQENDPLYTNKITGLLLLYQCTTTRVRLDVRCVGVTQFTNC